jgi:hypothetical protein
LTFNPPRDVRDRQVIHAVDLIRRLPLRWSVDESGASAEAVEERGWFDGAAECARALAAETRMEIIDGAGFGGTWPLLVSGERMLAPAMPVSVGRQRESGSDGEYRRESGAIWREAVGLEDLFLTTAVAQRPPGRAFELLWFGEFERFTVRSGHLEISDLFGELRVPAHRPLLEKLLMRRRRLSSQVIASLGWAEHEGPQTIEVRRPAILSPDAPSVDPVAFMSTRADVARARESGDHIWIQTVAGEESSFAIREQASGWRLTLSRGSYMFTNIQLEKSETALKLQATLAGDLDGMAPGIRGRLVFDLRSDLVALG